jgi:HK97 family phage prohead protease
MTNERRTLSLTPKIEERADKPPKISGYAAVYYDGSSGSEYPLFPGAVERIMPGAFERCLSQDVRGLFNHDPNYPLGRSGAGTLRLSVDSRGLKYEIDPPDSEIGRSVTEALRRGDVSGSSFSFTLEGGQAKWRDMPDGSEVREIRQIGMLFDVGPVTFPAYEGTSSFARSADSEQARKEYEAHQEKRRQEQQEARKKFQDIVARITGK